MASMHNQHVSCKFVSNVFDIIFLRQKISNNWTSESKTKGFSRANCIAVRLLFHGQSSNEWQMEGIEFMWCQIGINTFFTRISNYSCIWMCLVRITNEIFNAVMRWTCFRWIFPEYSTIIAHFYRLRPFPSALDQF